MTDNITLPRELVEEAAESLEWADSQVGGDDCYEDAAKALRARLAAPEPVRHPGYVIGNHWFETAYERLCAGEAEDAILEDYELVREPRLRDLRRDAERYRWMKREVKRIPPGWGLVGWDAAIDAAMQEDRS